jgi:hypothetical protein
MKNNSFLLTFIKNGRATIIMQSEYIAQVQAKRLELQNDEMYRGGKFEVRTALSFKKNELSKC